MRTLCIFAFVCLAAGALGAQSVVTDSREPSIDPSSLDVSTQAPSLDPALISPTPLGTRVGIDVSTETRGFRSMPQVSSLGPACDITCTGTAEGEACGDDLNGGCNDSCGTGFVTALLGTTYCGTCYADGGLRDTDWYLISLGSVTTLDLTINSEFPSQLTLFELGATPGDCALLLPLDTVNGDGCSPVTLTRTVQSGDYVAFVSVGDANGPIFAGLPCAAGAGNQNDYSLTIDGTSPATCLSCTGTAEAETCGADLNGGCNAMPPAFEPIAPSGTPLTLCGTSWADQTSQTRDTDWYSFTLASSAVVNVDFEAEFPGVLFLIRDTVPGTPCGAGNLLLAFEAYSAGCAPAGGSLTLGAGTYYLFVSVGDELGPIFAGADCLDAADYSVTISTSAVPGCTACPLPGGGIAEGEPCPVNPNDDDLFNGGCNVDVPGLPVYSPIVLGTSISGGAWADAGTRDTDWYRFCETNPGTIEITVNANIPVACFVISDEPGAQACMASSLLDVAGCVLGSVQVESAQNIPGTCTPTTFIVTINPNQVTGSNYVIFIGAGTTAQGLFAGFPCSPPCYGYDLDVGPLVPACTSPPTGTCDSDCIDGELIFNLTAPAAQGYSDIEITIEDLDGIVVGTVNTGPVAPGAVIAPTFDPGASGAFNITFDATCTAGGVVQAFCTAYVAELLLGTTDIIFDGDPGGCIDDAAALAAALTASGRTVTIVDNGFETIDDYACTSQVSNIWVTMGTFPFNFPMFPDEGIFLANGILNGDFNLYLSGGDLWGFDAPTAVFDVDGVLGLEIDGTLAADGDDSFIAMNGFGGALIDTSVYAGVPYNQDSNNAAIFGGIDFTDQLGVDAGGDSPLGSMAEGIWTNADVGNPYVTGIAKAGPDDTTGKVVTQSWEFGGFGDNQNALAGTYVAFFGGGAENCTNGVDDDGDGDIDCSDSDCAGTPACPIFRRGDTNTDGGVNIADAVNALSLLFPPPPPAQPGIPLQCEDTGDTNDDGGFNIADAVTILGTLFPSGSPPIAQPYPACGVDPTPGDPFGCANYPFCP